MSRSGQACPLPQFATTKISDCCPRPRDLRPATAAIRKRRSKLRFIRKAQGLGFSLDEIGEILKLSRSGTAPCSHVLSLAHQHLTAVEERIRHLQRFRDQLAAELAKWDGKQTPTCRGLCQIIAAADPDATVDIVDVHVRPLRRKQWSRAAR
jgi:hypothetical protein